MTGAEQIVRLVQSDELSSDIEVKIGTEFFQIEALHVNYHGSAHTYYTLSATKREILEALGVEEEDEDA